MNAIIFNACSSPLQKKTPPSVSDAKLELGVGVSAQAEAALAGDQDRRPG